MVEIVETLLECIGITLCVHRQANMKIKVDIKILLWFSFYIGTMVLIYYNFIEEYGRIIIFGMLLLYIKTRTSGTWCEALKLGGISLFIMVTLQIMFFYLYRICVREILQGEYKGIIINASCCVIIYLWSTRKWNIKGIDLSKGTIILLLYAFPTFQILYLNVKNGSVNYEISIMFLLETIGLSIAAVLWINAEIRNRNKAKELQMYELYNNAFEETIQTIRNKQHEFDNHINAIMCMQYSIQDSNELLKSQKEYCERILEENEINKLLKLKAEPVFIGFLYSKILLAKEKGIDTKYKIQSVSIKIVIPVYEFIELVGILFDNAIEAVEEKEKKKILIKLEMKTDNSFTLEIANISRYYANNEIEKFCNYGYSTKGKKRGIGLSRVKDIVNQHRGTLQIRNMTYLDENYLSFIINLKGQD